MHKIEPTSFLEISTISYPPLWWQPELSLWGQ